MFQSSTEAYMNELKALAVYQVPSAYLHKAKSCKFKNHDRKHVLQLTAKSLENMSMKHYGSLDPSLIPATATASVFDHVM